MLDCRHSQSVAWERRCTYCFMFFFFHICHKISHQLFQGQNDYKTHFLVVNTFGKLSFPFALSAAFCICFVSMFHLFHFCFILSLQLYLVLFGVNIFAIQFAVKWFFLGLKWYENIRCFQLAAQNNDLRINWATFWHAHLLVMHIAYTYTH